jgi:hypothetical protein
VANSPVSSPRPISEAHHRLGRALQQAREAAGITTRNVPRDNAEHPFFSSGHISLVENGRTPPSSELIDSYARFSGNGAELRALHSLAQASSAAAGRRRRQGRSAEAVVPPPRSSVDVKHRDDLQKHYVVVSNDAEYTFNEKAAISAAVFTVTLRPKSDGVLLYYAGHSYPSDQRKGVLGIQAMSGCTVESIRESPRGALATIFRLDRALLLRDAECYELTFRLAVDTAVPAASWLRYHAATGNTRMALAAHFHVSALPRHAWWFAVPDVVDSEHPQADHSLWPDRHNSYRRSFDRLVPGWCYGMSWLW